jgi:hypothetical protein
VIARWTYARAYRDYHHTIAESALKDRLTNIRPGVQNTLKLPAGNVMLREALINLGLIACLFLTVGGLLYLGTTALVAAPL